jgi:hypothetical protein
VITAIDEFTGRPFNALGRAILWTTGTTPSRASGLTLAISTGLYFTTGPLMYDKLPDIIVQALLACCWAGYCTAVWFIGRRIVESTPPDMIPDPGPTLIPRILLAVYTVIYVALLATGFKPERLIFAGADFTGALGLYLMFITPPRSTLRDKIRDLIAHTAPEPAWA